MKKEPFIRRIRGFFSVFTSDEQDFRIRLFRVLAFVGIFLGLSMALVSYLQGNHTSSVWVNLAISLISFLMFYFPYKTNRYTLCYIVSIVVVFLGLFTFLYLQKGAYRGGMPFFFILAIIYTLFMLQGRIAILTVILEICYYTTLFVYPIYYPRRVHWLGSERAIAVDTIVGFVTVAVALGATFFMELYLYDLQHIKLQEASREAEEANNVKSRFLGNISHEIRTPINVLLGMTELILRSETKPEVREYAKHIDQSGNYLLTLVNNLLDLSRIEAGKLGLSELVYPPQQLIRKVQEDMSRFAEDKGISLLLQMEVLPDFLVGDPMYIRQILQNLVNNAIKYTKTGFVLIKAGYREECLELMVEDTGIGIRKEQLDTIFEAFSRVDRKQNQTIEGAGLGLSIVKELVDVMQGSVTVESEYGKGSRFTVYIPQKIGFSGEETAETTEPKDPSDLSGLSGSLLAVDDREENLYLLEAFFQKTDLHVTTVTSGKDCLQVLQEKKFDLVLLDYMMPEMNGIETLHEIRKQYPEESLPVIALTADVQNNTKDRLLQEGFTRYLAKPVRLEDLTEILLQYLPAKDIGSSSDSLLQMKNLSEGKDTDRETSREAKTTRAEEKNHSACEGGTLQSGSEETAWGKVLEEYDICLRTGLEHCAGNSKVYLRFAELFRQYADAPGRIRKALEQGEYSEIRHCVHPMKSSAAVLGAEDLRLIAQQMETHAINQDRAFLQAAVGMLEMELERVLQGVGWLLEQKCREENSEEVVNMEQLLEDLQEALESYESSRAEKLILSLLEQIRRAGSETELQKLEKIRESIAQLEFEEAAEELEKWKQQKTGGDKNGIA